MRITRFEDIEAWKEARKLSRLIYRMTFKPLFAKDHALKMQMRSAAGSAMHNIAEGFDSDNNTEFIRFLRYAKRSCTEVQSQLYIALDERYISRAEFTAAYEQARITRATIWNFIKYLKSCPKHESPLGKTVNREP
jgi:four helix bundle protein